MKDLGKKVLKYAIIVLLVYFAVVVARGFIDHQRFTLSIKYFTDSQTFLFSGMGVLALGLVELFRLADGKGKKSGKAVDKVRDEKGNETKEFFSSDFVDEKTLKTNKDFNYNNWSTIRSCNKDGVLIRAEERGVNMEINFVKPIHTLCVGTTSSGKTTRFVVPTIQIMSMTAAKPSFVITDPKGELYELCSNKLTKEGYDVKVLDLRNPQMSMQWNPLTYPYEMWHRSFNLENEVKIHQAGDDPKSYNLLMQRDFDCMIQTWFEFNGIAYVDRDVLESDIKIESTNLKDKTFNALEDLCATLAPIESAKDPSWEKTARRLIHSVLLAMLEDSTIPELGLTKEKYTFYNVYKICNTTDSGRDTYATLKKYLFDYRDQFSKVPTLASQALQNAEGTSKNYMGFVSGMVALFNDTGICFMTCASEVDFIKVDERPTAIFLIIPDENKVRSPLAVLFVTQLYKRLVEKAQRMGGHLKRNVYFLLDEFGNLPKFPDFGTTMAVGRSRGIFFELCVQSYSQLYSVYGQDEGKIIKDNCPIQVYIASEDTTTNKEFSELLGKKTIVKETESESKGPDGKKSVTTNRSVQSRPIAYPEELPKFRDQDKLVIKTFTPNAAILTTITPYFKVKSKGYDTSTAQKGYSKMRTIAESEIFYDIKLRNKIMASKSGDDEDDDDDLF